MKVRVPVLIAIVASLILGAGCNVNKNTSATRHYQAFLTRYNIQYNGDRHYNETLEDMINGYQDDYDRLIPVHPALAHNENSGFPRPSGNFERSIEKAQKAIALHSIKKAPKGRARTAEEIEWKTRSEYNPYLHNSWMLFGKSLFMQGHFRQAANVFYYISQNFRWLPSTVAEARAWEALCYCGLGEIYEAEGSISSINMNNLSTKDSRLCLNMALAFINIDRKDFTEAANYVREAILLTKGVQKLRLRYLLGQIEALAGDNSGAYREFSEISRSYSADYRMKLNARVAMSGVTGRGDIENEIKKLKKELRYESNRPFRDRIYYALGNLYLHEGDTAAAIASYNTALENNGNDVSFCAMINLALGKLYYDSGNYADAALPYARALLSLRSDFPDYQGIMRRSEILDRYYAAESNILLQDSLLELSHKGIEACREICEKLAKEYVKAIELEKKTPNTGDQTVRNRNGRMSQRNLIQQQNPISETDIIQSPQWYFYNPAIVAAGKAAFQRIWGDRKLADDWRLSNRVGFDIPDISPAETTDENNSDVNDRSNPDNEPSGPEYYLKNIPFSAEQKTRANNIIASSMYDEALILKNDIGDELRAKLKFKELLNRYPDFENKQEVYHELFLLAAHSGDEAECELLRQKIANDYPATALGRAMADPMYLSKRKNGKLVSDSLYRVAYESFLKGETEKVRQIIKDAVSSLPPDDNTAQFHFLAAMTYAVDGKDGLFKDALNGLKDYKLDERAESMVAGMLANINSGKRLVGGWSLPERRRKAISTNVPEDLTGDIDNDTISYFKFSSDSPHLIAVRFVEPDVNGNELLFDIAAHNFNTFRAREFDVNIIRDARQSYIIISGLNNVNEAVRFRELMFEDPLLIIPDGVDIIIISREDYEEMKKEGMSWEMYNRERLMKKYDDGYNAAF